jgi:muramoyltetrapeptide carboxypeptidase
VKNWIPLQPGDIIDLVAPGFPCKPETLEGALHFIRQWGFTPRLPERIFRKDILCASPDEVRFEHLSRALKAPDSKAVWCLRGGYGSIRLLPRLRQSRPPSQAKLFVGLSDITSLHVFLNQEWGWSTVHGPMIDRLGQNLTPSRFVREMFEFVTGTSTTIEFGGLRPLNAVARRAGRVQGAISGGNLITLQSTLATEFEWQTRGRILFFEDIGERGYRVDRVLEHFRQAGRLKGIRAVVFGDFTGGKDPDGKDRVPAVLKRFAESLDVPVVKGVKCGHGPIQRPVPLGPSADLILGDSIRLVCSTGAAVTGGGRKK